MLSGQTHEVYTGVPILVVNIAVFVEKTKVTFWELSEAEIERYLDTGNLLTKLAAMGFKDTVPCLSNKSKGTISQSSDFRFQDWHGNLKDVGNKLG